jgi:hypothetical protein
MKKITFLSLVVMVVLMSACGPSEKAKKEKATQDSIAKADSIAKSIVEVESYDFLLAGKDDTAAFKSKYSNRKLVIKNLVVENIWDDKKNIQCLAYIPKDTVLASTSRPYDKKRKMDASINVVQGLTCKFNEQFYGPYYIELRFKNPVDIKTLKEREVKEEPKTKFWKYFSVLTVEGDSAYIRSNSFVVNNCVIKENSTK